MKYDYGHKISPFQFSDVDIIIPYHGQYMRVRNLVESILLHTTSNEYLITLVDDGSPNAGFLPSLMKAAPVMGYRLDEQRGFAAAFNHAYERTVHNWVCVIHSDCLIQHRLWLQAMGESLLRLKSENVRLVHARTNVPTVEHTCLTPTTMESKGPDQIVEDDDPLPLVCAMFHRELLARIGGPLKSYPYAGYENVELYYRMKRHGHRQAVSGASWVYHEGGATIADLPPEARQKMEENYDLCVADVQAVL